MFARHPELCYIPQKFLNIYGQQSASFPSKESVKQRASISWDYTDNAAKLNAPQIVDTKGWGGSISVWLTVLGTLL